MDDLLPETGPQKHTIITTRNPNAAGIPAEGFEVPLLEADDIIDLLSTLSNVTIAPNSPERKHADEIVQKLRNLSLAIIQATAYVRKTARYLPTFLEQYDKSSQDPHRWVAKGNRQYPFSIATTWSTSFNIVQETDAKAAKLFQLLSFLNPDDILIDFLILSSEALENGLRQIVSNGIDLAKVLIELKTFSLIKWNRLVKSISIHRLVQTIIKDEIRDDLPNNADSSLFDLFYSRPNRTKALFESCRTEQTPCSVRVRLESKQVPKCSIRDEHEPNNNLFDSSLFGMFGKM